MAGGAITLDGAEDGDITMDGVEGVIAVGDKTRLRTCIIARRRSEPFDHGEVRESAPTNR
jgi:hypothetical protein